MADTEKWLREGEQTKFTPKIKELAEDLDKKSDNDFELIIRILEHIQKEIEHDDSDKDQLFRERTAAEILEDGFSTGCTDHALVFITVARAAGIPTKYIEGVQGDKEHLKQVAENGKIKIKGHVIAKCFIKGEWYGVDPSKTSLFLDPRKVSFLELWEGLDSWDLNLRDKKTLSNRIREYKEEEMKDG